jgi:hypothetical protein
MERDPETLASCKSVAGLHEPSWDRLCRSLGWNESTLGEVAATLGEIELGTGFNSILVVEARSGKLSSPSTNLSRSLQESAAEVFGFMSTRNHRKLPTPSAMQTHEPKTNVVPWEGSDLMNLKDAMELTGGSSTRSPTWRASCRCLTGC